VKIPLAFFTVVIIWSTTPLAIKWSSVGLDPMSGVYLRMLIAASVGWALLKILRIPIRWDKPAMHSYLAANIGICFSMCIIYWAAPMLPSGTIAVLFGLSPLITGVMATRYLNERSLSPLQWISSALSLLGLILLLGGSSLGSSGEIGVVLILLSVLLHCVCGIMVKKSIASQLHPFSHAVASLIVAIPFYSVVWLLAGGWDSDLVARVDRNTILSVVYLGTCGSLIGFVCYFYILSKLSPTTVALTTLVTPIIALFLGAQLAGEVLGQSEWVGISFIMTGLLFFVFGENIVRRLLSLGNGQRKGELG